jgi:hypothetical protein
VHIFRLSFPHIKTPLSLDSTVDRRGEIDIKSATARLGRLLEVLFGDFGIGWQQVRVENQNR